MKARPVSAPPRSSSFSKPTTLLNLRSAIVLVATALLSTTATAESGAFELQTNLVSCGGDSSNNAAGGRGGEPTAPIAVCSPPESKLFNNVRVVNGTPQPGPTGVRGRLYDVGNLCTEKVSDKIDRAWIAFLDCGGGCTLSAKLANLQGSNPQAVLIYNQDACIFSSSTPPASTAPAPATGGTPSPQTPPAEGASPKPTPATPNPAPDAPAVPDTTADPAAAPATPTPDAPPANAAPAPAAPTPDAPPANAAPAPAAPTQPTDSSPNGGDKGGDVNGDGDSYDGADDDSNDSNDDDRNDDGEGGGGDNDEDNGENDNSNDSNDDDNDDNVDEGESARKHPRSFQPRNISGSRGSSIISLEGLVGAPGEGVQGQGQIQRIKAPLPQGSLPRPRSFPHVVGSSKKKSNAVAKRSILEPEGRRRSPRPRPIPHPHIVGARRAITPDNLHSHQVVKAMDIADAFVQFPVTVALAEQVTIDYLLNVLTGPAASSPLPAPLKTLKTTVNPNGFADLSVAADGNSNNTMVITDLMVSISPAYVEPIGERKHLSMSKPIFATVIGILSAVVCGVVLMYVVRPLVKRHRKQSGGSTVLVEDNESDSRDTSPSHATGSRAGGNGYYGDNIAYTGNNNNNGSQYFDGGYDAYNQYSSKEAPYSASSTGPNSQPPPMQEVYSEKYTHSHQKDSNSAPAIFDRSLSGNNTPHSATVFSAATVLDAVDSEDPEYAQKQLELLRKQDQLQAQSVPLPASTVATPTTATTPSVTLRDIQSARTRYNWGSNTPTTPNTNSISTPTSTTATVATTATPNTTESQASSSSAFDNTPHAPEARLHNRISSLVNAIPEESSVQPATPQDYAPASGLTPATSGHHNQNAYDDDEEDRYSAVSSRNGSDLFHSDTKPRLFPTSIDTSTSSTSTYGVPSSSSTPGSITRDVGGGLATALYKNHRLSMDNPGGFSPAVQSPFSARSLSLRRLGNFGTGNGNGNGNGNDSNNNNHYTPYASMSNDILPSRVSTESPSASYRENSRSIDIQTRFQDLMSSSRSASGNGAARSSMDSGTPRASFSDDYRHRLPTTPSSSRFTTTTNCGDTTPRVSISNDSRVSMDSQHRSSSTYMGDVQTRFQDITSPSRSRLEGGGGGGGGGGLASATSRASFSEDFPARRPSLDAYRANMSVSTPTSATVGSGEGRENVSSELMSPMREQRASTANWSRYARRDPSGAAL